MTGKAKSLVNRVGVGKRGISDAGFAVLMMGLLLFVLMGVLYFFNYAPSVYFLF